MIPGLNKNEFLRIRRSLSDARELLDTGHPKSALTELRSAKKLLESQKEPLRAGALLYLLEGEIYNTLHQPNKALNCLNHAIEVLDLLQDTDQDLRSQIENQKKAAAHSA